MPRFHWHVEHDLACFIPPCGMRPHRGEPGVQHAVVEMEVREGAVSLSPLPIDLLDIL